MRRPYQFLCIFFFFLLNFQPNLSFSSSLTHLCSHHEAAALIQFKNSFSIDEDASWDCDDAGIKSYPKTISWKEGTDCCSWKGISCDRKKGQVIGLDLSCSWLHGTILPNSSLFHLPHLQKLNLAFNNFYPSNMSSKFGEFPSLVYLNLSGSSFSGQVPSKLSHLSKLVSLDLSNLFLTFEENTLKGLVENFTEVREVSFDGFNMPSINLNVLMNLSSSLTSLSLDDCGLRGKLPTNVFHLPNLRFLNLRSNKNLSFNIPKLNQSSHLEELDLSYMSFTTEMIDSIGNLQSLRYLDLSGICFPGGLPDSIGNLVSLKHLDLSSSSLNGGLPDSIGNLVSLTRLDLSSSSMKGGLPDSIGNLVSLKHLDLSFSSVNGGLPDSIGNLVSLKHLDLSFSSVNGGLPDSIGNLVSLKHLDASNTSLFGGLPNSIGNLVSLRYLDLRGSKFLGSIPRSLGNLSQLSYLDLSNNFFSGQLPCSLTNLMQLENLDMSNNSIEGSIPDEETAFPNLISLDLSHNLLNGSLPSWLYVASSLKSISLFANQLSGHIKEFQSTSPEEIRLNDNKLQGLTASSVSQLVNLTHLDLSSNNLSGTLELGMFSKLQNLQFLDISQNSPSLNCNVTSAAFELPNLKALHLPSCNINEFPQFFKGSKNLQKLDLSNNKIKKIPKWMWDVGKYTLSYLNLSLNSLTDLEQLPWQEINYLDLSSNLIRGDLPIPPSTTQVFLISNNSLSGETSSLICSMRDLNILDLSHNNLSGIIPPCFGDLSQSVSTLNLQKNRLFGIIPSTFAKGCQLSNLNLNGNQLTGPLTRSISNCTNLEVLDLGDNKINDTFPHWLGSVPELQVLVLKSNHFHGPIYDARSAPSFSKIQIFDLSNNRFVGPLPVSYIENFRAMINLTKKGTATPYMGVSFAGTLSSATGNLNKPAISTVSRSTGNFYSYSIQISMKGQEIELVKIFALLTCIDLSNNKFEGEIPKVIGKLNSLKGLNISHNNLSGCIPSSMGSSTNLEWLDLSSNKLVGTIPESLLDLTSLSSFNVSGNELVGCIPRGKQFNTFENNSYLGNDGLRGFPLSSDHCGNNEPPQPPPPSNLPEEDDQSESSFSFGWKIVAIGYGCGVTFGLAAGCVVFRTGKPAWIVALVENQHHRRRRKSKTGCGRGGVRRA